MERRHIGSAYGIIVAVENIGLSVGPLLVSAIHSATSYKRGYFGVSILNLVEALIGTGLGAYLFYYDYKHSRVLLANSKLASEIQRAERIRPKAETKKKLTVPAQIIF